MLPIKLKLTDHFLDEEVRCGYTVSHEMKEVWAVELDLLNEFMRVCNKHKIRFYADGGTILGAIRHKGFIPWDDDIDVMLFRDQYEKLCKIASHEFQHPYFFQTEYTDKGSLRGHAQLRNSETTGILYNEMKGKWKFNQGIFLDIFPIDSVPDDPEDFDKMKRFLEDKRTTMDYWKRKAFEKFTPEPRNSLKANFLFFLCRHRIINWENHTHRIYKKFEQGMQLYNKQNTRFVAKFFCWPFKNKRLWERSAFDGKPIYHPFEMLSVPLPPKYEYILDTFFENWREFQIGTATHGGVFFNSHKSYTQYVEKL